jgi:capsid protein
MDASRAWAVYSDTLGPGSLGPRLSGTATAGQVQYEKIEDGQTYYLRPGDKMMSLASDTPNDNYIDYVRHIERTIGQALGVPYEFLKLDFSETNFSNARAALIQTHRTFEQWQTWLVRSLLSRLWNWRIQRAIQRKEIGPAPLVNGTSQYYRVEWSFPEYEWVDPQAQVQSELIAYQLCKTSLSRIVKKTGADVEDVLREKAEELAKAQIIADEVGVKYGVEIDGASLINAQIPGQQTMEKQSTDGDKEDDNANP